QDLEVPAIGQGGRGGGPVSYRDWIRSAGCMPRGESKRTPRTGLSSTKPGRDRAGSIGDLPTLGYPPPPRWPSDRRRARCRCAAVDGRASNGAGLQLWGCLRGQLVSCRVGVRGRELNTRFLEMPGLGSREGGLSRGSGSFASSHFGVFDGG